MGDRRDFGGVVGEGLFEGRQEMLGLYFGKGRRLERRLPRPHERVRVGGHFQGF